MIYFDRNFCFLGDSLGIAQATLLPPVRIFQERITRTDRCKQSSFFPDAICSWNNIVANIQSHIFNDSILCSEVSSLLLLAN